MIAADCTGHAGGDGDDHNLTTVGVEGRDDDGDQDAKGAPGGAGGKGESHGNEEDDGGRNDRKFPADALTRFATYSLAPRESVMAFSVQAKVKIIMAGDHGFKALWNGVHTVAERKNLSRNIERHGDDN